jgi:hypothetical protein
MRAWWELQDRDVDVACSLERGERLRCPDDRALTFGHGPACDVVLGTTRGGPRRLATVEWDGVAWSIRPHGRPASLRLNGQPVVGGTDLHDGDVLEPVPGTRLRFVVDVDEAGFDTELFVDGGLVLFDRLGPGWRCVPVDAPDEVPRRVLGVEGPDPLRRAPAAFAAGVGTTAVHRVSDDGERRLVVVDDVAGAHLGDLLRVGEASGATLDPVFTAALLGPSLPALVSTSLPVFVSTLRYFVTFDGAVRMDGFVGAALLAQTGVPAPPTFPLLAMLARLVRAGVLPAALDDPPFRGGDDAQARLQRVLAWCNAQPAVEPAAWRALLAGVFPARVAREEALRARLAALDDATIARLPAPGRGAPRRR